MRSLIFAGLAPVVLAGAAQAQTFTFSATSNPAINVGTTGPDGVPVAGAYWTGNTATTWADGKKSTESYACVSTTQPPNNAIFNMHAICDAKGPEGTYTSVWGCNFQDKARTTIGCVGGLYGKTGIYAGKGGGITFAGQVAAGTGTGQWRN